MLLRAWRPHLARNRAYPCRTFATKPGGTSSDWQLWGESFVPTKPRSAGLEKLFPKQDEKTENPIKEAPSQGILSEMLSKEKPRSSRAVQDFQKSLGSLGGSQPTSSFVSAIYSSAPSGRIEKKTLQQLKYWSIYPKQVKKWVAFTKTPRGYYNELGAWIPETNEDVEYYHNLKTGKFKDPEAEEEDHPLEDPILARVDDGEEGEAKEGGEAGGAVEETPETLGKYRQTNMMAVKGEEGDEGLTESDVEEAREEAREEAGEDAEAKSSSDSESAGLEDGEGGGDDELKAEGAELAGEGEDEGEGNEEEGSSQNDYDDDGYYVEPDREPKFKVPVPARVDFKSVEDWQTVYETEQARLPPLLRGQFRYGIKAEEIENYHPKIKRLFSFSMATKKDVRQFNKVLAIEKWKEHALDTGSDAIQIDILTQRIRSLIRHLNDNKQDKHNARKLQILVKRRKGLILHLKKRNVPLYYELLREIKLRDMYELYRSGK